jgi:hypothetical protein
MMQVFHLDVAKVDLMLHMLQWDSPAACGSCWGAAKPVHMLPTCMCVGSEGGASGPRVQACGVGRASRPGRCEPPHGHANRGAAWESERSGARHDAGMGIQTWASVWMSGLGSPKNKKNYVAFCLETRVLLI